MSKLTEDGSGIQQAVLFMDVLRGELRIVGAVAGKAIFADGTAFHTLLGAKLAFLDHSAATPFTDPRLSAYQTQRVAEEVARKLALEQELLHGTLSCIIMLMVMPLCS